MKNTKSVYIVSFISFALIAILALYSTSCKTTYIAKQFPTDTLYTNSEASGFPLELIFQRGSAHNYPLMAVWISDTNNRYIETLYIAQSIGRGYFEHADKSTGKWLPGEIRRPAALPVWSYSRNVKEADGLFIPTKNTPVPDGITGATPQNNFVLITKTSSKNINVIDLYFEINQTWDWNEYWTNTKYPSDVEYKTSCQPALVYRTRINVGTSPKTQILELIGRSEHNGSSGKIYTDLETITSAKNIAESIVVKY